MRIAIVGSGVAGLSAGWFLSPRHEVSLFEAAPRLGGHAHTIDVAVGDRSVPVDTGFIVYNEATYPLFTRLLGHLGVATRATTMSFSASIGEGRLEYRGHDLRGLVAQPRNLARPAFLRMLAEVPRFNAFGLDLLRRGRARGRTLGQILDEGRFGRGLREWYLGPMAAAIWSAPLARVLEIPADTFLTFFANHHLLTITGHHPWRTVEGGARGYVERLVRPFLHRVALASPVRRVRRRAGGVELELAGGERRRFDRVVLACHADEASRLLADASPRERAVLGSFRFQDNRVVLHGDARLMPVRRAAWAAWNYRAPWRPDTRGLVAVTYWMNSLQGLATDEPLFVTMNPPVGATPSPVHADMVYRHPVFDGDVIKAQEDLATLQGGGGVFWAGAWCGYGFHEDGVRSGLDVARALGCAPPWEAPVGRVASSWPGFPEGAAATWA